MSNSIGGLSASYSAPVMDGFLEKTEASQMDLAMKLVRMNAESKIEAARIEGIGEIIDTYV
jgi:hypothetical protein